VVSAMSVGWVSGAYHVGAEIVSDSEECSVVSDGTGKALLMCVAGVLGVLFS
jgi:hypothetical protein